MHKPCVIAVLALLPSIASAQFQIVPQPPAVQLQPATDDAAPSSGVYVQDSAIALDRMALAQRMENLKEWGKSAEIYQEIIEKFSDRVVPSHHDDKGAVDQYTSVMALVNQHLRAWPPEGLAVYRTRYELTAQNLLRTARGDNLEPLHDVFSRYFVSDSGKQAGLRLIDAYFELGDFPAASWIGQALLGHPNIDAERPGILFRVGLAAHYSGDQSLANSALNDLKTRFATVIGAVGGHDVNLAAELEADLAQPVGQRTASAADSENDSWPTPGGDLTRGRVSFSAARPGAKLYSLVLPAPNWRIIDDITLRKQFQANYEQWRGQGKTLGIIPSVDRGELYFQDNARVYAVSLDTGQVLPGWLATYPSHNGQYVMSAEGSAAAAISPPAGMQLALSLTDTSVLAVMGLSDSLLLATNLAGTQDARLVCLDRAGGRENWTVSARDIPVDNLKNLRIGGAPLVAGNNVYLAGLSSKGNGYEDCYVLCFDLASGKYRWSTYVAGAPMAGQTAYNPANGYMPLAHLPAHLAYAGGRLFVVAGVGAVAALDAYSGNVDWLNIYREADDAVNPNNNAFMGMGWGGGRFAAMQAQQQGGVAWNPPSPWALSAPLVHGGNVFVLPTDGKYVLVYDAGDGHLVKRLEKENCCQTLTDDSSDSAQPDTLLAALDGTQQRADDLLLVATPSRVCAIRWRDYDPLHPTRSIVWATVRNANEPLRGQPFVTADSVYIPTTNALRRVALRNGLTVESYPAQSDPTATQNSWPAGEGPGNVLAVGDHIVVAGDRGVSVYTDMSLARARLDKEVAAAPDDPNARLHYAEVMFLDNQTELAIAKLDEAIKILAAQTAGARDVAARGRAFNDAMNFAVRSSQNAGSTANAGPMFDRAGALADSPGQQVAYRMARARFARYGASPDLSAAIRFYQEILADSAMRNAATTLQQTMPPGATASDADQEMMQAGNAAKDAITSIISTADGAAAYETFEQAAHQLLAAADKAKDPDQFLSIWLKYPNSSVSAAAERHAGDLFEALGRTRQAIDVWRDIAANSTDSIEKSAAMVSLARNYLKLPNGLPVATGRLIAAVKENPDGKLAKPIVLPGAGGTTLAGATISTAAAKSIELLAQLPTGRELNLPDFGLAGSADLRAYRKRNPGKTPEPFLSQPGPADKIDKLLIPAQEFARLDRVAAWAQGRGVGIYPVGAQVPVGFDADIVDEPRGAAWVNSGNGLLVWTANQVVLVSAQQSETRWKVLIQSLPDLDVLSQSAPQIYTPLITQMNPRAFGRGRQRQGLMPVRSTPFQAQRMARAGLNPTATADDSTADTGGESIVDLIPLSDSVIVTTTTGRVLSLKLADGAVQWDMRLAEHAADRVAANDDFVVVKSSDEASVQMAVLDTDSGRMLAHHLWMIEAGGQYPVNIALADDGTLAFTTPDRIMIFDLFNGDPKLASPKVFVDALPDKQFDTMRRADELALAGGQILALCVDGKLRGFSANTGQARQYIQDQASTEMALSTGNQNDQTAIRVGERYAYAWGPSAIIGFNMDKPELQWGPQVINAGGSARQLFLGKDYLLVLSPASNGGDPTASWTMWAFSRTMVRGSESGLMVYQQSPVDEPQGISAFQAVESGLYYLSGDHLLHYLKGNAHLTP